jgi:hypothetical protein
MKIKNKIFTLLGVFTLVGLTYSFTLKDLNAALTAPASYDFNYQYSSSLTRFVIGTSSVGTISPSYQATADGVYTNYSATLTSASNSGGILPQGFDITMTFNRSNTSWQGVGPTPFINWRPNDTKIGTDSSVGNIQKFIIVIDNQTNKNYSFILDTSSSPSGYNFQIVYNINSVVSTLTANMITTNLREYYVPSFTNFTFQFSSNTGNRYFDAWYLIDLGQSQSYDVGYYDGYDQGDLDGYADGLGNNPNILLNGFQAMVGILVNFMLMILNLEVFGVSILSVFGILALFVGVIWILKIVRG